MTEKMLIDAKHQNNLIHALDCWIGQAIGDVSDSDLVLMQHVRRAVRTSEIIEDEVIEEGLDMAATMGAARDRNSRILNERSKTHGDYTEYCKCTQMLKDVKSSQVHALSLVHKETLDMIFGKIARILTGDPDFEDHWRDIAGYATRAAENLNKGE